MVDRPAKQVEAGLLFLVLELDPQNLNLADLTQRMSASAEPSRSVASRELTWTTAIEPSPTEEATEAAPA